MGSDHYFSAAPASAENLRTIRVTLAGRDLEVTTAAGVFSPDRMDAGTGVLLAGMPPLPPGGHFLDLGSGWGPISLTMALASPHATVWAVDVNERALDLVRRNAEAHGLTNINAVQPDDVPDEIVFRTIRSNPPIRVGKNVLHDMLEQMDPAARRAQRRLAGRPAQSGRRFTAALAGGDLHHRLQRFPQLDGQGLPSAPRTTARHPADRADRRRLSESPDQTRAPLRRLKPAPRCSAGSRSPRPCNFCRSVPGMYSVWYTPRRCSSGTMNSTTSSKVPGVIA